MINPILRNEMKTDSRRFRFFLLLMIYVALLGVPTIAIYHAITTNEYFDPSDFNGLYIFLACSEAVVLMFIVPALSASSICGEREKQTLDILLTTKMTPTKIIFGKLLVVLSKVTLLIICTLPIFAVVLFLGGIKMSHIIFCNLFLLMTTVFVASMSIWVSTLVKTSKMANVMAYAIEMGFVFGIIIAIFLAASILEDAFEIEMIEEVAKYLLFLSPASGYLYLLTDQLGNGADIFDIFYYMDLEIPAWIITVAMEGILSIFFIRRAIKRLNPIKKKRRSKRLGRRENT